MVVAIMVMAYEAVRNFKTAGFRVQDWFGDMASIRERYPDKPLVGVVVGHPEYVDDIVPLVVGPYRFSLRLKRQLRPLLHSGAIPRCDRNEETKDPV